MLDLGSGKRLEFTAVHILFNLLNNLFNSAAHNTLSQYAYLSSTIMKEVANFGGDLSKFAPREITDAVEEKLKKRETEKKGECIMSSRIEQIIQEIEEYCPHPVPEHD